MGFAVIITDYNFEAPIAEVTVEPFQDCPVMPYLALSTCNRIAWSTVSKAAERSMATRAVMDCFSKAHSISLLIFKTAVSHE